MMPEFIRDIRTDNQRERAVAQQDDLLATYKQLYVPRAIEEKMLRLIRSIFSSIALGTYNCL